MAKLKLKLNSEREVLLIEIERYCAACDVKNRIALTKDEAHKFIGFKCDACEQWNDDMLAERDVPEWWEELKITGLYGLRLQDDESKDALREIDDAEFEDEVDVSKILQRAVRETKKTSDAKTSAHTNDEINDTSAAEEEAREIERLREIIRRRKREEKIF